MDTRALATALIVAFASPAMAADEDGDFAVKGAGLEPCKAYLSARENESPEYLVYRTWLNGFVTGYNMQTADTYDVAPLHSIDDLSAALARVCQNNPDKPLINAAAGVVQGLQPARTTRQSQSVEIDAGDTTIAIPANLLARVQQRLKAQGLYDGPIDAKYGPGTRGALEAYQDQAGMEATGLPNRRTIVRLMQQSG
jgi:hypothetical protein